MTPDALLRAMLKAAIESAMPEHCVPANLPELPRGRTVVVGAGKASAAMAQAFERNWTGDLSGLVITRYGHMAACERVEVVEAGHPVPDAAGVDATRRIRALLSNLDEDDLVVCLLSGGGSALLVDPAPGVTLADKRTLTDMLLRSGATIGEINCVRKHVSQIKGGRLATAVGAARLVTLAISDAPGDAAAMIASGPTVPDRSTRSEAIEILARHAITPPAAIAAWLNNPDNETPKITENGRHQFRIIAAPAMALQAAAAQARDAGWRAIVLGDAIEGEARNVARAQAQLVRDILEDPAGRTPCVLLSGGETTVTVRGRGRGGRNTEFLLALALELNGADGVYALAADTDGIDGLEDNAGACLWPGVIAAAAERGKSAADCLADNDAYAFFEAAGGLVFTGPTRTNVNDFRAIAISAAA